MHKISLKKWVIILTILPTTLISLSIASYFSYSRYIELNDFLTLRSQSIIEPLAVASISPILTKDREKLRYLIGLAHRRHSDIIKSITVFTPDNQVLVTSIYNANTRIMRLQPNQKIPDFTQRQSLKDDFVFRTPIIHENKLINDATDPNHQDTIAYISMQIDKSKVQFKQQSQMLFAFALVLFGTLISGILSIRLIKNVTKPIGLMVEAIDRIREGKLESRINGQLIGELNFLKNGVNAMAQSLTDYHDEMQRSIDQTTIDLRESLEQFEIQNVELNISKRKAQEANRVKSEFLANMSHELRTPLNGVIGFTRQVLKTPLSEIQRDCLQTIEKSANNLLTIINDILDFSKLDVGKMVIEKIPFSLRESIEETLTLLSPLAHQKNIELSLRIAQELPDNLIGDAMRIKQVVINLANNAIKFTKKGSVSIDIEAAEMNAESITFKITVTDTGIGMNKKQQKIIFEAFGQADQSITRLYGGTGLGLVISQHLAKEMKGAISFSSKEQVGSTFWFTFKCDVNPLSMPKFNENDALVNKEILYYETLTHCRVATTEIMENWNMRVTPVSSLEQFHHVLSNQNNYDFILFAHDTTPNTINELKMLLSSVENYRIPIHLAINSSSANLQERLLASGATSCLSKPITPTRLRRALLPKKHLVNSTEVPAKKTRLSLKVLAVDDNEANLKLIKALLLEQVTEVIIATDGEDAFALCESEMFALIFMDIQMPVMDGVTAMQAIQANTVNSNTPIIAVTAHSLSGEKEKLLQQGFSDYMAKPIDETRLRHMIYEYGTLDLPTPDSINDKRNKNIPTALIQAPFDINDPSIIEKIANKAIDWSLALQQTGNKAELAKEMLEGLVNSLPDIQAYISDAIASQDIEQLKSLIHKLNGACCYTGVPHLRKITHQIETDLKTGMSIDDLEPEFLEFFEHLENVMNEAPELLKKI
jgi:two-component system, NarL family, sensor histidine kinase BarA